MEICCIADIHIGVKSYSSIDPKTHFYTRELEALNNLQYVINKCLEKSIPILVIAGDIYHNSKPSPNLQNEVNKILYSASERGLYILILDGNHDLIKQVDSVSVLRSVSTFKVPNIIQTSNFLDQELTINNETIRFIFLPTYTTTLQVKELLDQHLPENNNYSHPVIVIGHFTTQGAQLNDWLIAENEEYIDINIFNNRNINYIVLGHLHKPQILKKSDPLIFYTGSLQRTDFNEENQEKGYWIINTLENKYDFKPIDTQKFYTIKLDITEDIQSSTLDYIKQNINTDKLINAIVRILIDIPEKLKLTNNEEKQLIDYINAYNPYQLLPIKQNITDAQRVRNPQFTELLTVNQALEIFYKDQFRSEERIKLGKEIFNKFNQINT